MVARQQMAQEGTAGLSLRAIATEMGITAPALYRYYKSRDELVTALIVDAFNSLGEALRAADATRTPEDYVGRIRATSLAYREWAIGNRTDHALIFGNPIPGYHAPPEITTEPAQQSMAVFIYIFVAAWQAGRLDLSADYQQVAPDLEEVLGEWLHTNNVPLPTGLMALGLALWAQLQGLVIQELNGHLPPGVAEDGKLYRFELNAIIKRMGLKE